MKATFGECELDTARVELRRADELVPVQPQVFAVIEYLIRHRDRAVPKVELLDEIWGDRFVGDGTLASRVKFARRAVGDDGNRQEFIKTVHGHGYRFVADVTIVPNSTETPGANTDFHDSSGDTTPIEAQGSAADPGLATQWPLVGRFNALDEALVALEAETVGGLVLIGPDRVGKTRLAIEILERCRSLGHRTERVNASSPASTIPLAALAPLLPPDVLEVEELASDFSQTVVLQRAQSALESHVPATGRLVIMVDNAQHLDDVSETLLAAMMTAGSAFVVATLRTHRQQRPAFDELVRGGTASAIELQPLDEAEVDTLLYRVLEGPIDPATLDRLGEITDGSPGLLHDVVRASIDAGTLIREDGVWRLVGAAVSDHSAHWPIDGLSSAAVHAAEMLGLIGSMILDDATALFDTEALDELDHKGLVALTAVDDAPNVTLSDPLLAERVCDTVPPIRGRRHKAALTAAVMATEPRPTDLATVASWAEELGQPIDVGTALLAARRALMAGQDDAAASLIAYLRGAGEAENPYVTVIDGELCFRRAQLPRAAALLNEVDIATLDPITAAFVLRRIATIQTQHSGSYGASVKWLISQESEAPERVQRSLAAQRLSTMVLLGRVNDVVSQAEPMLETATGFDAIEVLLSRARAYSIAGQTDKALADVDDQQSRIEALTPVGPEADLPHEAAASVRLNSALVMGEIEPALEMVQTWAVGGKRTLRHWLPMAAAEVHVEAGNVRRARELIYPGMEVNRQRGFVHARLTSEARFALTSAKLGRLDEAAGLFDMLLEERHLTGPGNVWHLVETMVDVAHLLGRAHECRDFTLEFADDARAHGALLMEANLLFAIATADKDPAVARDVVDRVVEFSEYIGGRWWPVKASHVQAIAAGESRTPVIERYRALGYIGSAERAQQ